MTDREKAIVMAYTGVCMLTEDKFSIYHKYIEDICGRPIYTHELANRSVMKEIEEKSQADFIELCREEPKTDVLDKIRAEIEEKAEALDLTKVSDVALECAYIEVLKMIDKYRKQKESEV